tara:strand:- start:389 stop:658 length:270 start_codon:yes stop_codon:yes gene_type:complete
MDENRIKYEHQTQLNVFKKKKALIRTITLGTISISSYVILFINEEWVIENFSKGSWYAIFPILTAFLFSLVHGSFASNLIKAIGIKEKK